MILVTAGSASHVGRVRSQNEDSLYAGRRVWAVADGMGGHAAGEVASALAVGALRELDEADAPGPADVLLALTRANDAIMAHEANHRLTRGMGTTLTGVALVAGEVGERLMIFNVGDSRTYRLVDGVLKQATVDHSETEELIARGVITRLEARTHPMRNIITRALGTLNPPTADTWLVEPTPGERFLVCSDGLTSELPDDAIAAVLLAEADPQAAADALVTAAVDAGGHDNVTVIVLDVTDAAEV